jgi:tetratricopeptide (TPR) repeat protein
LASGGKIPILKKVRRISTTIFAAAALWWLGVGVSAADQNDSRLDTLFAQLLTAPGIGEARPIEISIWEVWTLSDDSAVAELMKESAAAMSRRDYPRALRYLDQVVAIAPEYAEGWNRRATVYYLAGRYEDSLADIARTLALEPRHFGALSGRGLVLTELEREEEALRSFEEALTIHPHLIGARINADALREVLQRQNI